MTTLLVSLSYFLFFKRKEEIIGDCHSFSPVNLFLYSLFLWFLLFCFFLHINNSSKSVKYFFLVETHALSKLHWSRQMMMMVESQARPELSSFFMRFLQYQEKHKHFDEVRWIFMFIPNYFPFYYDFCSRWSGERGESENSNENSRGTAAAINAFILYYYYEDEQWQEEQFGLAYLISGYLLRTRTHEKRYFDDCEQRICCRWLTEMQPEIKCNFRLMIRVYIVLSRFECVCVCECEWRMKMGEKVFFFFWRWWWYYDRYVITFHYSRERRSADDDEELRGRWW